MSKLRVITFVLLTLMSTVSYAADGAGDPIATAEQARDVLQQLNAISRPTRQDFLTGSVKFSAYHEFGHFLVNEYDMQVLSREEDVADSYAIFALAPQTAKEQMEAPIRLWLFLAFAKASAKEPIKWWDEHSIDHARAFQLACYLAGAWPNRFAQLLGAFGASKERAERCGRDSRKTGDDWKSTLLPVQGVMLQLQKAVVTYKDAPKDLVWARDWLMASGLLESIAVEVRRYQLPRWRLDLAARLDREVANSGFRARYIEGSKQFVEIAGASCGQPNAFYVGPNRTVPGMMSHKPLDPQRAKVVVCYELVNMFREIAEAAIPE